LAAMTMPTPSLSATQPIPLPGRDGLMRLYREMLLLRQFEERVNELYLQGKIP
jgi:TPP-dependent pyruvate/acetoin dehydrogenase alpha subunit